MREVEPFRSGSHLVRDVQRLLPTLRRGNGYDTAGQKSSVQIWAFRYSSETKSRSLFYTTDLPTLRRLHPEMQVLQEFSDDARLIVSEPLGDVAGVWDEVPESSWGVVGPDREEVPPFRPRVPSTPVPVSAKKRAAILMVARSCDQGPTMSRSTPESRPAPWHAQDAAHRRRVPSLAPFSRRHSAASQEFLRPRRSSQRCPRSVCWQTLCAKSQRPCSNWSGPRLHPSRAS